MIHFLQLTLVSGCGPVMVGLDHLQYFYKARPAMPQSSTLVQVGGITYEVAETYEEIAEVIRKYATVYDMPGRSYVTKES